MANFRPKVWVNPYGKMSVFRLLELFVLQATKAFFRCRISLKTFSQPILPKKKVGKRAIFGPKPWVNPFGKMSIFRLFELLITIAQKGVFSFQNIVKDIFLVYIALKKKLEKWPFLDQNHGLTLLEKCQFFAFLNILFLKPRKAFFCCRISQRTFFWTILTKKKTWKNGHFWTKTMG